MSETTTPKKTTIQGKAYHWEKASSASGWIVADNPTIKNKLSTLAPMIFPSDKSGTPLRAAVTPVTSSGREVPSAITENPIMADGMPHFLENNSLALSCLSRLIAEIV